jgi:hypothetical protein
MGVSLKHREAGFLLGPQTLPEEPGLNTPFPDSVIAKITAFRRPARPGCSVAKRAKRFVAAPYEFHESLGGFHYRENAENV